MCYTSLKPVQTVGVCVFEGDKSRRVFNLAMTAFIAYLSIPAVQNILSSQQVMNTTFEPLRIVNTYGAFGR